MIGKNLRKIIQQLFLMFCVIKTIKNNKNHENICHSYVSKHNSERESQIILLNVSDNEKLHYLAVTKLSALLRVIISKYKGVFYFLNCLYLFRTKIKLKSRERVCKKF